MDTTDTTAAEGTRRGGKSSRRKDWINRTIQFPPELYLMLNAAADNRGTSVQVEVINALRRALEADPSASERTPRENTKGD